MKKFMEAAMQWKTAASLIFTGTVIIHTIVVMIAGVDYIPVTSVISLLIISTVGSFIQLLAFSDFIIKKMRYTLRLAVFVIPFFAMLTATAKFFNWFPAGTVNWLAFSAIFLVVFAGITVGFEVYYRVMGQKYDGLLGQYRKQRESAKQ